MSQIEDAFKIFHDEIYPRDGDSVMCEIHKQFGGLEGTQHNCLGCNFADATSWIHNRLHSETTNPSASLEEFYFDYLIKLYLLIERVYIVFEIIGMPPEYRGRHFDVFQKIHKWANFIKHPKSFLLVHHPSYFMERDSESAESFDRAKYGTVIDQDFVSEYYAGPDNNSKLRNLLMNKKDIAVLFPNVVTLTEQYCKAIHEFLTVIRENAVYREVLNSRTTFENYFDNVAKEAGS